RLWVAHADATLNEDELVPPKRDDLPIFTKEEVKKHGRDAEKVWVTYKGGVYDVTEFVEFHPGGDKILLAAGGSIEPYWNLYAQHKTEEVLEILEELRIGSLDSKDVETYAPADESDPYAKDPIRHPALVVNQQRPFNAETPSELLMDNFRTPNELFFVRNHMPVPQVDPKKHTLVIEGMGVRRPLKLSVDELKKNYKPVSITSVVQVFSAAVEHGDELDWKSVPSIQEYPIQSAFCLPLPGAKVKRSEEFVEVAGYAWSGGGRGIIRVEVSADGGKTWQSASLEQDPEQDLVSHNIQS
ncbi:unnamed protein product, partial [Nippostrongylus brasiliensis]|uniref:sulfite oxidase n=1 Tax=Nippostrongylus brasiliensis TaxID=27835 RepID=A0A0N4YSS2_NIPBR